MDKHEGLDSLLTGVTRHDLPADKAQCVDCGRIISASADVCRVCGSK